MKKICHMTSAHKSNDVRIFHKMCASLAAAGYDTYLVAPGESREEKGVHVTGIGERPKSRVKRMTQTARSVYKRALEIDADLYHFHDPELLPYGLKLKKRGKTVIFDSHEDTVNQIKEKKWLPVIIRKPLFFCFSRYHRYCCKKLDAVISVSPNVCDRFALEGYNAVMICNFPIICDNGDFVSPDFSKRKIVYAGGIGRQWSHEIIIRAIEQIKDVTYALCGTADANYLEFLKSLDGWEKVDFLGAIPHVQVACLFSSCSVGMAILQPGMNTGGSFGTLGNTKIFEYMRAGLPIICTNSILWKQIVSEYNCGICVNPDNIGEIADAIRYLLEHPQEARQMGENGRQAVINRYNWGEEEKKLLLLYSQLT